MTGELTAERLTVADLLHSRDTGLTETAVWQELEAFKLAEEP